MIKYYLFYPVVFKLLSSTEVSRKFYRFVGDTIGDSLKRRRGLSQNYVDQGRKMIRLLEQFCNIKKGDVLLELGTGWIHWYATFVKVFHDVEMHLFDVWDNRQLSTLKQCFSELPDFLDKDAIENRKEVLHLLEKIAAVESFDELYELLSYNYVLDKSGNLTSFSGNKFDVIFSVGVFEHINKNVLSDYTKDMMRILKPGGYSVQMIDIADHYHYLDPINTNSKEYLRFSDRLWRRYFQNSIHYINRLQVPEWLDLFKNARFQLIHHERLDSDIGPLRVSKDYKRFTAEDLRCHQLIIVHQKPLG